MSDDDIEQPYAAPAPPSVVGALQDALVTYNVVGGADYGIYSSIP